MTISVGRTMLNINRGTPFENIHPRAWYTLIFENFDCKMVPSRLWLPLFHPRLSGAVLAQGL